MSKEKIESRRAFMKKFGKLAGAAAVAAPFMAMAAKEAVAAPDEDNPVWVCGLASCSGSCDSNCSGSCAGECDKSCVGTCDGYCDWRCEGSCYWSCAGAKGCANSCVGTCSLTCSGYGGYNYY